MSFELRDDGLWMYEESRHDKTGEWVQIADHFATPARVSDPRTGGAYGLRVEFTDERGRAKQLVVRAASFHGNTREICAALGELGLYIKREYQECFIDYLQREMLRAPSADLAVAPGWLGPSVFALPSRIFGEQENGRAVYYGGDSCEHSYRTRGTLVEWQERVARPCIGNSNLVTSVSAALAGPLMVDAGENSGGLHFYGRTSRGKTTLLLVAGSVCGGGDPRTGFTSSWRTTANGLEPLLSAHNDGSVFLDEIGQADGRAIGELIYTAGNSLGKHRMTRELLAAPTLRWRVMILSTGEHTIEAYAKKAGVTLPGGAIVRMLDLPTDDNLGAFEDIHGSESAGAFADKLRGAALECYGVALQRFLDCLVLMTVESRRAKIVEFRERFLAVANLTDDAGPEVKRAANRMALIAAAGELAIELDILPWEPGAAIDGVATCFAAWRQLRGGDQAAHDDERAIEQIRLFLERFGESRFDLLPGRVQMTGSDTTDNQRPVIDRAGWRRRDGSKVMTEFLVQPEFFQSELCRGFDAAAVARALHKQGFLRRQGKHWTIRTTIHGAKRDVYCILQAILTSSKVTE